MAKGFLLSRILSPRLAFPLCWVLSGQARTSSRVSRFPYIKRVGSSKDLKRNGFLVSFENSC